MLGALAAVAFFLIALGLAQFVVYMALGAVGSRKTRRRDLVLRVLDGLDEPGARSRDFAVYFLIPCLNERLVIGDTVRAALRQGPHHKVVVVDDGSEDDTGAVAQAAGRDRVLVCRRELPEARQGKGMALNAGLSVLRDDARKRGLGPANVIVCVMDADGRLSSGAVTTVTRLFLSPRIGGIQLPVRIRNRGRWLTDFQDFEFWGLQPLQQAGRSESGTVSLGGNGQFTRLMALDGLGAEPWSDSLTEDLDLSISLIVQGWMLGTTLDAHVSQQAVESLRRLIRQRSRWLQGHIVVSKRLGEVWRSDRPSSQAVLEVTAYLTTPFLIILPWSVIFNLSLVWTGQRLVAPSPVEIAGSAALAKAVLLAGWYLISFAPHLVAGCIYFRRRRGELSLLRALVLAHLLFIYNYVTFIAAWRGLFRVLRGETRWEKTGRVAERRPLGAGPTPLASPALFDVPLPNTLEAEPCTTPASR
jgi:cellulose synthase/poly-beta-1,6-N-acetylglucosamine synthase-like glycosyltransferase